MSAARIRIALEKAINTQVTPDVLKTATRAASSATVDIIRKRSLAGIDRRGRRFPPYTRRYKQFKARAVRGKAKIKDRRTPFAAKSVTDYFALSGRTLSDMYVKSVSNKITRKFLRGEFIIDFRSKRSRTIVDAQVTQGRDIRGLAPENSTQGKKERAEIRRIIKSVTRVPRNKRVRIEGAIPR